MIRVLEPFFPLYFTRGLVTKLRVAGFNTYQAVADASKKDLVHYSGISVFEAERAITLCREVIESDDIRFSYFDFINEDNEVSMISLNSEAQIAINS